MAEKKMNIESKVENLIQDVIEALGYILYDVIYVKEGKDYYLKVFIDKLEGITIEDCEVVSNAINDMLDKADYIKEMYFLEVSSPGVERILRKKKHFLSQIGNEVCVKLFYPIQQQKEVSGILQEYNDKEIILQTHEENMKIDLKNVAIVKTIFNW